MLFGFFQESTTSAVTSVVAQEGIVRKTQFPRLVIPLSIVLTGLMNLGLNLIVVFIFILAYGVDPMWTWLLLPFVVLALTVLTTAVSMLLSALYVRFRDLLLIWTVAATMLFYGTPILYPIEIPTTEGFRALLMANPIAVILEQARVWIIDPTAPTAAQAAGGVPAADPGGADLRRRLRARLARLHPPGAADRRSALAPQRPHGQRSRNALEYGVSSRWYVPVALQVSELTYEASPSTKRPTNTAPPESPKQEPAAALGRSRLFWNATISSLDVLQPGVVDAPLR